MLLQRARGVANATLVAQLAVVTLAYWAWVLIWEVFGPLSAAEPSHYLFLNEFLVLGVLLGSDRTDDQRGWRTEAYRARLQTLGGIVGTFAVLVVFRKEHVSRAFLIGFLPVLYGVLRWANHVLPRVVARMFFEGRAPDEVLLVGSTARAGMLSGWLGEKAAFGLKVAGILTDGPTGNNPADGGFQQYAVTGSGAAGDPGDGRVAVFEYERDQARPQTARNGGRQSASRDVAGATSQALVVPPQLWGPANVPESTARVLSNAAVERDCPYRVLGHAQDLAATLAAREIQQVLVLGLAWPEGFLQKCVSACEREGVRLFVVSDLDRQFRHTVTMFEDKGVQLIGLREEPLENPLNRLSKRLLDLLVAVPVTLLVLPPAMVLAWIIHRWQSPGPLFFRQQRSGYRKRVFMMYKFRTMHAQNDDETRQARRDDPRVFAGGMWMRRFSVDELPQFINVLRGDMSVVGPRPHMPAHDTVFIRAMNNYRVRAAVKPGLTGLAQVRGYRGGTNTQESVAQRVASDIEYLERWTLGLDFWIIARTFWQVIFPPKTAY